jgi:hypothetical protein
MLRPAGLHAIALENYQLIPKLSINIGIISCTRDFEVIGGGETTPNNPNPASSRSEVGYADGSLDGT